jgi:hypothetical protein
LKLDESLNELEKASLIYGACMKKQKSLDDQTKDKKEDDFQRIINSLFENLTNSNHSILNTMLDAWGDAR